MSRIAIIGGTGLESLPSEWSPRNVRVSTVFGEADITELHSAESELLFVRRHGPEHGLAPHLVNYRANVAAIADLGVTRVFATNAVGSLRLDLPPGSLVAVDDFIDFTSGRSGTFWEGHSHAPTGVTHTDFSQPYCPTLRSALLEAAAELDITLLPRGTYVCVNGPRFESPAEIRMFAQWGGDVIGMTGLPEAVLAREAGLCYSAIGIVTNYAAGLTAEMVRHEDVLVQMAVQAAEVRRMITHAAKLAATQACEVCRTS